ncbi:hypothetical protein Tsp_11706 [Trichinella spiralis]|uniref:hypothetical protein n=1 Tax=Trichinella spiralis TaxID=6334 RepID=UPI0001EFE6D2|nr:hypothetical protein Tsp_11706 [Trichinella spiralis]
MNNTHWRLMRSSVAFVQVTRKQAQPVSQQSENSPVDLCWSDKSAYWASPPIEDTNGLTCNISSLDVFAGTHPLVHIISVIHRMKMISRRQKLKCSHKHTRKHIHMNSATQPPH